MIIIRVGGSQDFAVDLKVDRADTALDLLVLVVLGRSRGDAVPLLDQLRP